ncbi:hypothetical protein HK098_002936 [Nowakowskiella sp. JEL0407]|nr:hypothetical protein HK098_002936 [Nowakowskiella sp. JEL0407]
MKRFPDKDILRSSVSGAWNECSDNIQFILQDALINRTINALIRDDTPLMRAVMQQKLSVVKLLISHGADVNFTNEKGKSAIHHAIKWGRSKDGSKDGLEIFNVLRSFGGLIKEDHIRLALKYANVEILQVLLPYPPTEKVRNLIESTLFRFYSRSQYRRWYKFSEMTSDFAILLDYTDVNVNVTNEAGVTLLEIAIGHNASYEFINLLSSKGAKWDLRWGRSAMSVAIHSKAYNSISGLLEIDSSLANMKISSYSTLQLPLEALYPEKDLFQFSRDYEMNIAGFVKLVNLTKDKRVVWNSLSRIIRNWENCRAKLKIADIDILEHEVHERRTLRLIDSIARNLFYTRAEEIGKLESTMYVTDWTISIVRTYFSTIVMFVARNWADPITELPFELWLSVLRYCEPRWQGIK